ncbi:MAG: plasmid pRiA4b ORF-3 family protein [Planctomycetaceae bacterium]
MASPQNAKPLFQLMITLLDIDPPIWRRIGVPDCTLNELHEFIQTAMGWTNSHLHRFEIGGMWYCDPNLMEEDFDEFECEDSTTTKLSRLVPSGRKKLRFIYVYDFGDSWTHEIVFEGTRPSEDGKPLPVCVEGERACPPEDIGGPWGYEEFLEAIADPEHEQHEEFQEWSGPFDPEAFDAQEATRAMREGLPDRRD